MYLFGLVPDFIGRLKQAAQSLTQLSVVRCRLLVQVFLPWLCALAGPVPGYDGSLLTAGNLCSLIKT
jgi:hypothetical protein